MLSSLVDYFWSSPAAAEEVKNQQPEEKCEAPATSTSSSGDVPPSPTESNEDWVFLSKDDSSTSMVLDSRPSSMENLLIEHPSMSVYHRRDHRTSSTGDEDTTEQPSTTSVQPPATKQRGGNNALKKHINNNQVASMESAAKASKKSQRSIHYKQMQRANKIREVPCHGKQARRCHLMATRYSGACNDRRTSGRSC